MIDLWKHIQTFVLQLGFYPTPTCPHHLAAAVPHLEYAPLKLEWIENGLKSRRILTEADFGLRSFINRMQQEKGP